MTFKDKPLVGAENFSYKHGMSNSRTWSSWRSMHKRCRGQGNDALRYKNVKICERWKSFENFLDDMGERPENTSLDRIDGRGDYEPSNCRWATPKEQVANSTPRPTDLIYESSHLIKFKGQTKTVAQWARHLGVSQSCLSYRLKCWSPSRALTTEKRIYSRLK